MTHLMKTCPPWADTEGPTTECGLSLKEMGAGAVEWWSVYNEEGRVTTKIQGSKKEHICVDCKYVLDYQYHGAKPFVVDPISQAEWWALFDLVRSHRDEFELRCWERKQMRQQ